MIKEILQPLVSKRFKTEPNYRDGHLRIINALPERMVMGLHSPEIKQIAKTLSRENGKEYIGRFEQFPNNRLSHEECVIWGYLINLERCTLDERLQMLQRYVPTLDNWAVCDSYCAHAKWMMRADKKQLWAFLQQWFESEHEFEVRFALVTSMCYFLSEEWLDTLFARLETIDTDKIKSKYKTLKGKPLMPQQGTVQGTAPYYVRMGVAWLLATALAKFPDRTREFVRNSQLPDDIKKLYVRKARESFRTRKTAAI